MDAGPSTPSSAPPSPFADDVLIPSKPLVDDARFDVTAMVDLVFMMNIFFLVTWVDMALAEIDLPTARHCAAADKEDSVILTIMKGPQVFLGDASPANLLSPGEVDQRVTSHVEKEVRDGKTIVLVKAEKDVPLRDVAHVSGVATAVSGVKKLMLAVLEKKK
jgi:biopolymer transport protein ExbD